MEITPPKPPTQTRPSPLQLLQIDTLDAVEALTQNRLTPQALVAFMQMSFTRGAQDCLHRQMAEKRATQNGAVPQQVQPVADEIPLKN